MKKLFLILCLPLLIIACQEKAPEPMEAEVAEVDPNLEKFHKNVETTKAFLQAFCDKDSTKMFSYASEDFLWSPPSVGRDSLPRATWEEAMKGFMGAYNDIEFTNGQYFAGLDDNQKPNGDVRVYGLWKSKMAETGSEQRLKWYAVLFFNEEGKAVHSAEWYDTADLTKPYEPGM
ncbi:MAG: nuclear transport factor 2 family protein [Flavobacteriaceae bacterium]